MPDPGQDKKPAETPRHNRARAVGADAAANAGRALARAGFRDPTLVLRWEDIAGPEVARLARPVKLRDGPMGGVLTLKAEPGAALFLQHESRVLCERINDYLGRKAVVKLRFTQGPVLQRPKMPVKRKPAANLPADDPAASFKGPEKIRESLLRLARLRRRAD